MIAGMVMDALGFLLVSIPIFFPVVMKMGYDPIWFGCILCVVTTLGAVTPPVGICAYIVAGMDKETPLGTVLKGVCWYLPSYWIVILLMLFYPQIALFLPSFVQ
jgi:TRAP-type C4-dicarboxylate transport system permease large subunit